MIICDKCHNPKATAETVKVSFVFADIAADLKNQHVILQLCESCAEDEAKRLIDMGGVDETLPYVLPRGGSTDLPQPRA